MVFRPSRIDLVLIANLVTGGFRFGHTWRGIPHKGAPPGFRWWATGAYE